MREKDEGRRRRRRRRMKGGGGGGGGVERQTKRIECGRRNRTPH